MQSEYNHCKINEHAIATSFLQVGILANFYFVKFYASMQY
jgi:hypothetical protein